MDKVPQLAGLIPKGVTYVSSLIEKTGCDGRGVTVAVLDTGIDPGAPGLELLPDGQRKILDVVDCTGSGDVDMSTEVTIAEGGVIEGLSGRKVMLSEGIVKRCRERSVRLGMKDGFSLFPGGLVRRLKKERRVKWDKMHRKALSEVRKLLGEVREGKEGENLEELEARESILLSMEKNYRDVGPIYDVIAFHDGIWRVLVHDGEGKVSEEEALEDFRMRGRFGCFGGGVMMNYGVKVYDDGKVVSLVVDGGGHGTHVAGILAGYFGEGNAMNGLAPGARLVSLKIGDSRLNTMETHQGIVRALAYLLRHSGEGEEEEENKTDVQGKAEKHERQGQNEEKKDGNGDGDGGARKEGDGKANALQCPISENVESVGQQVIRIDVVNMSFGEHSRDVNKGRFVTLVNKLVHEHNVLFLSSAGNEGPALSSVSAPGGTTEALIGVGAYVTPTMLTQAYSYLSSEFGPEFGNAIRGNTSTDCAMTRIQVQGSASQSDFGGKGALPLDLVNKQEPVQGVPYTWSSRGPVTDGSMGVSVCAPGGAIAPVPVWMLRKKVLMNGTSMSSPSAAGATAVILSFLKSRGIQYTSALVRRAIENTARPLKLPRLGLNLEERKRALPSIRKNRVGSKFDTNYYQDLVFAVGHGSVDAFAACEYLERYAARRGLLQKNALTLTTVQQPTVDVDSKASAITAATESTGTMVSENGPSAEGNQGFTSTPSDRKGGPICLEDWIVRVRVEDGSPARQGSNNPGLGTLNTTRGIYLRGESETSRAHRAIVSVEAVGRKEESPTTKRALATLEVNLSIQCEASWVEVPSTLLLLGGGRSFPVVVNPSELGEGRAHFAEIVAYPLDMHGEFVLTGPLFRVPVTVHKPEPLVGRLMINPLREVPFTPGSVIRRFYEAPVGATYGLLKVITSISNFVDYEQSSEWSNLDKSSPTTFELSDISSREVSSSRGVGCLREERSSASTVVSGSTEDATYMSSGSNKIQQSVTFKQKNIAGTADARNFEAHIVQISPQRHCGELESRHYFTLRPGSIREFLVYIQGGSTLELCLAQLWSSPGRSMIERVELVFGGVIPLPPAVHAFSGDLRFPRVEVSCYLPPVSAGDHCPQVVSGYSPRGMLINLLRVIAPCKSKIRTLGARDMLPGIGAISQLQLEYSFEIFETSSSIRLLFVGLNRAVYESEIEGGPFVLVHDKNKQFMFASDIYPPEQNLQKGEYFATAYIRHDRVDILESLRDVKLTVEYDLPSDISLDAYESSHAATLGIEDRRVSRSSCALENGERRAFYFGVPKKSQIPKWAEVGDTLIGRMTVDRLLSTAANSMKRGCDMPSYELSMSVPPSSPSQNESSKTNNDDKERKKSDRNTCANEGVKTNANGEKGGRNDSEDSGRAKDNENAEKAGGDRTVEQNPDKWFEDAVRKLRVKRLRSLLKERKCDEFDKLYETMEEKYAEDVEILMLEIERLDVQSCGEYRKSGASEEYMKLAKKLVTKVDEVIERLDTTAVATHFGMMIDPDSSAEADQRKSFETRRNQLVEALFRKSRALLNMSWAAKQGKLKEEGEEESDGNKETEQGWEMDDCNKCIKELGRWVSVDGKGSMPGATNEEKMKDGTVSSEDLLLLVVRKEERRNRFGMALKLMENFYGSAGSKRMESAEMIRMRERLFEKLGWSHLEETERNSKVLTFPKLRVVH